MADAASAASIDWTFPNISASGHNAARCCHWRRPWPFSRCCWWPTKGGGKPRHRQCREGCPQESHRQLQRNKFASWPRSRETEAKELGLKDAEQLFKQIEERTREKWPERAKADPKKAISELNDVVQKNRRAAGNNLGGDDKLRQQLDQMKKLQARAGRSACQGYEKRRLQKSHRRTQQAQRPGRQAAETRSGEEKRTWRADGPNGKGAAKNG